MASLLRPRCSHLLLLLMTLKLDQVTPQEEASEARNILEPKDVVFVVLSQPNSYHAKRAQVFEQHFLKQIKEHDEVPYLHFLHKDWSEVGAWTVLPIIPDLLVQASGKAGIFFCEEETRIDVYKLMAGLSQYDTSKKLFLGRALRDKEATIIHHFAFYNQPEVFAYPDFAAGFFLSLNLATSLMHRRVTDPPKMDFSIDVKHELAMYIHNEGAGTPLTDASFLCAGNEGDACATSYPIKFPGCGKSIAEEDLFVFVKTCEQFHTERVPVVQKTWAKDAKNLEFASEVEDPSIPTVAVVSSNTERGHCAKFKAILDRARTQKHIASKAWIIIVDDDTLISIPRLRRLLACYDPTDPVALGERYGYGTLAGRGYDYITGGGGMVLSMVAVRLLADCECGSDDAPDDMTLGMCLRRARIPVTHSPLFHQARPADYSEGYLSHQLPISFHKHWMVDPVEVYREWLEVKGGQHDEL